jgi:tetratricopeptide (TPR) repeat protein
MRAVIIGLFASVVSATAWAQPPDRFLGEPRLTVHTLVREDIFAGFLDDNMTRFSRAEKNIELLLKERPDERANLLAWKAGAATYRAVRAHEAGSTEEFERLFAQARAGFAEAAALQAGSVGVPAVTGGTLAVFADRLPETHRASAWSQAYDAYSSLWKQQGAAIDKMPQHMKGELLAGLAQSAQRTGRTAEATEYLDKMLALLAGTPYEATAQKWKADPASAASTNLTCKSCHGPGRLSARVKALGQ